MKPLSTLTFAAVLSTIAPAISATAAINCGSLPSCADLGYTDTVANCPGGVLKCPFDTNIGKCIKGPSVGDLKYSLNPGNHDGWILCNGQFLNKTKFAELYKLIGTNYTHSSNQAENAFSVPDYRGFFLRGAGAATFNKHLSAYGGNPNSSLVDPQKEQLPNIGGNGSPIMATVGMSNGYGGLKSTGAISFYEPDTYWKEATANTYTDGKKWWKDTIQIIFDASKTTGTGNGVYQDDGHVIPANYAAHIFIYSGVETEEHALHRCKTCGFMQWGEGPSKCPSCGGTNFMTVGK